MSKITDGTGRVRGPVPHALARISQPGADIVEPASHDLWVHWRQMRVLVTSPRTSQDGWYYNGRMASWFNDIGAGLADAGNSVGHWTTDATGAVGTLQCPSAAHCFCAMRGCSAALHAPRPSFCSSMCSAVEKGHARKHTFTSYTCLLTSVGHLSDNFRVMHTPDRVLKYNVVVTTSRLRAAVDRRPSQQRHPRQGANRVLQCAA